MMGADTIPLGFGSNLCWFLWVERVWVGLGLVWFGLLMSESTGWWVLRKRARACVCCCRSGELMMLPKPDSVWIWPKRVGMLRTWFFCFVLFWTGFVSILGVRRWTHPSFLGSSPLYIWLLLHSPSPTQPPPTIVKLKPPHARTTLLSVKISIILHQIAMISCYTYRLHPVMSVLFLHTLAADF